MAATSYGVNHPLAVKLWSNKLFQEALKQTEMAKFIGEGSNNVIQLLPDTRKSAGDRVTVGLRMQLTGQGIQGEATLEGNEEALTTYSDNVFIDQLRHAVRSGGKMSEQRIPFEVREEARAGLTDWWKDRIDSWIMNQLTGNTGQVDTRYTGNQAAIAPSSTRYVYPIANEASEASISTTSVFSLAQIDRAVAKAKTLTPMIRPLKKEAYDFVCFIHPYQVWSLRSSASTSGSWADLTKAMLQGGQSLDKNMFGNAALGIWNRTLIVENSRVPLVTAAGTTTGTNIYRAVFTGGQAAVMCVGRDNSPERMSWIEELFDYKNQLGVSAGMIAGVKKTVFNSLDFGALVLPSFTTTA